MPTTISIVVFRGRLPDVIEFRDAAVYFIYSDGCQTLIHVIDTPGFFEFASQEANDPRNSANFAGLVIVSLVKDWISRVAIEAACASTAVRNDLWHHAWNSSNWVCQTLTELQNIGCLADQERSAAIFKMKNFILEAEDKPRFTSGPLHIYHA
ncbi:hypothetical protein BJX65DRAFT_312396 [Aspergillus insuetus]